MLISMQLTKNLWYVIKWAVRLSYWSYKQLMWDDPSNGTTLTKIDSNQMVFINISFSIRQSVPPTFFKAFTIIPAPKKPMVGFRYRTNKATKKPLPWHHTLPSLTWKRQIHMWKCSCLITAQHSTRSKLWGRLFSHRYLTFYLIELSAILPHRCTPQNCELSPLLYVFALMTVLLNTGSTSTSSLSLLTTQPAWATENYERWKC